MTEELKPCPCWQRDHNPCTCWQKNHRDGCPAQADKDTVTLKRGEVEKLIRLANNVCLQRLNGTIIDEGSSIFELSTFLKQFALGKGE